MLASRLKGAFLMGGVGGMSPEHCRFRSMLSRSHYLISLLVYHMQKTPLELWKRYHQGSTNQKKIILMISSIETWKVSQTFFKFQSMSILTMRSYKQRKTVSMAEYRLGYCFSHVIDGTTRFNFLKRSSKKRDIAIVIKWGRRRPHFCQFKYCY